MSVPSGWSAQKLAEFLAEVSSYATEAETADGAVERVAESLDADVVAIVAGDAVVAAVGCSEGMAGELAAVAAARGGDVTVPGHGRYPATVVPLEHPRGASLVVARAGPDPLSADELSLLHAMARVTSMTLRMRRFIDDERALREESQRQSAENAQLLASLTAHQVLLERLAKEQAALRRVATLVASQPAPAQVLAHVTEEVGRLLRAGSTQMLRCDGPGTVTVAAGWAEADASGREIALGTRFEVDGDALVGVVVRERRATRMGNASLADGGPIAAHVGRSGLRSATASPIEVEGRLWGVMVAAWSSHEPPADAESRIVEFARLAATAISNAHARAEVERLADTQAALRRVATLVAQGERPEIIFTRVAEEIARIPDVDIGVVLRYEPDDAATVLAATGRIELPALVGTKWPLATDDNVVTAVYRTGRPARIDDYRAVSAPLTNAAPDTVFSTVAAPVVLRDRLWGAVSAMTRMRPAPAADAESGMSAESEARIRELADLVAIAISNADARAQLTASRARVVAASDEARRRLERNLHDGVQQGLVSLALALREAESLAPADPPELRTTIGRVVDGLTAVLDELREISRGLHPALLSEGGLAYALRSLARRSAVPTTLHVRVPDRLPERIEVPAYYLVSEALTNAAKHAQASVVDIDVEATDGVARIAVRDDGVGGADIRRGSGLIGLVDRVEAAGGELRITSRPGEGTSLLATFPLTTR